MSTDTIIELENVSIFQKNALVLSDVSFKIDKGEFVFLIGKTGSGKSSLLKTIYADLPLIHGQAYVSGFDLNKIKRKDIPFLRRKLGIVFQDFQLLSDRTVSDNLLFVMKATGWKDKKKMKSQIQDTLTKVGLGTKGFKMPHQLSGGEQQRVAIARALVNEPSILLADEPTGNLDSKTSIDVMSLFQELNNEGITILLVTHEPDLAQYSKRIVVLRDGFKVKDEVIKNRRIAVNDLKTYVNHMAIYNGKFEKEVSV